MTVTTTASEIVRKQVDAFNAHNTSAWAAGYAPEATVYDPYYGEPLPNRAAIEQDMVDFFRAFPDAEIEVTRVLSEGPIFAYECTLRGTHQGDLELPTGTVSATNRRFELRGCGVVELDREGRIVQERRYYDVAGQMAQLGLL